MSLFNKKTKEKTQKASAKKTPGSGTSPAQRPISHISLVKPHVTEKTLRMSEQNSYVFIAPVSLSKIEAAKQIEKLYGVTCIRSRVTAGAVKPKMWRGKTAATAKFKKIIVTLKEGQKIELTGQA